MANIKYNPLPFYAIKHRTLIAPCEMCNKCKEMALQYKVKIDDICRQGRKKHPIFYVSDTGKRNACYDMKKRDKENGGNNVGEYKETPSSLKIIESVWDSLCDNVHDEICIIDPHNETFNTFRDEFKLKIGNSDEKFSETLGDIHNAFGAFACPVDFEYDDGVSGSTVMYIMYYIEDPQHITFISSNENGCVSIVCNIHPTYETKNNGIEYKDDIEGFRESKDINQTNVFATIAAFIKLKQYILADGRIVEPNGIILRSATSIIKNETGLTITLY